MILGRPVGLASSTAPRTRTRRAPDAAVALQGVECLGRPPKPGEFGCTLHRAPAEFEDALSAGCARGGSNATGVRLHFAKRWRSIGTLRGLNNRGAVLVRLFRPAEAIEDFDNARRAANIPDAYSMPGNAQKGPPPPRPLPGGTHISIALAVAQADTPRPLSKRLKLAIARFGGLAAV